MSHIDDAHEAKNNCKAQGHQQQDREQAQAIEDLHHKNIERHCRRHFRKTQVIRSCDINPVSRKKIEKSEFRKWVRLDDARLKDDVELSIASSSAHTHLFGNVVVSGMDANFSLGGVELESR